MKGIVELRGLTVSALVGILPEELERAQPIEVDLDVHVDIGAAAASDALGDAVDYGAVCDAVVDAVTAGHVGLLERLVRVVGDAVLAVDARITAVDVVVRKLRPPVPHQLATSGVRAHIER